MTDSLLSHLQSATDPSRELDADIALANGWTKHRATVVGLGDLWKSPTGQICPNVPRYTESIDAICRDLLSDDMYWDVGRNEAGFFACVWRKDDFEHQTYGSTSALALLIAIHKTQEDSKP